MGGQKLLSVLAMAVWLTLLTGCAEWENVTPNALQLTQIAEWPDSDPRKEPVQMTAVARHMLAYEAENKAEAARIAEQNAASERQAAEAERESQIVQMTREAQAVIDARENAALATRMAINSQATAQAVAVDGTRQAQNLSAEATAQNVRVQATATSEARNAEGTATAQVQNANATATVGAQNERATATAGAATATAVSALQAVEATAQAGAAIAVDATSQAVQRETDRQRITQPLLTFGPWLLAVLAVVAVVYIGFRAWQLFEDRRRLVRRRADEGEPIMIISRERIALPARSFGVYNDLTHGQENAPLLAPTIEAQEAATGRQQAVNAIHAQQVAAIAEAQSTREPEKHITVMLPEQTGRQVSKGRRKTEAGLIGPLTDDAIPPKLLEAITAQWEVVEDD